MSANPIEPFLDRTRSFAAARAAIAALELDLFPALAEGPKTADELSRSLGLAAGPIADTFFDILVTAGFLERAGEQLELAPMSRAILESYEGIRSWGREMRTTYRCLDDLEGLLKTGAFEKTELARFWAYKTTHDRSDLDPEIVRDYSTLMDTSQENISQHIAAAYDFSGHDHVMDFGGGYGRLAMTLSAHYPDLRVTVVDLEVVCRETQRRIADAALSDRADTLACDFLRDPLPERAADVLLFCRVLHDWSDDEVARLLERTRHCLRPGGVAIAVEPMFDETEPLTEGALPAALMLSLLGGRRRSVQAYERLFRAAGYAETSWRESGQSIWRLVTARLSESRRRPCR